MARPEEDKILQRRLNPETLKLLKEKGSNMGMVHTIINVFHLGKGKDVKYLVKILAKAGQDIEESGKMKHDDAETYWYVHSRMHLIPTLERVDAMTDSCVDIAEEAHCEYDGWYTQVGP